MDSSHPLDKSTIFDRIYFSWVTPVIKLGTNKILEGSDIHELPKDLKMRQIYNLINEQWEKEKLSKKNPKFGIIYEL